MKEELKQFDINIDDIKENDKLLDNIQEAIEKLRIQTYTNRFEIILNKNLLECKDKCFNYRTILGCKISYDDLPKEISFVAREDINPSYEELVDRINDYKERIDKAIEYIESYLPNYDFDKTNLRKLLNILKGDK